LRIAGKKKLQFTNNLKISGKKSCPPKLLREESASSDCTEETYLAPNSLKPPDLPDETTKIPIEPEDPEFR
jgi:hypothetical protein